MTDLKVQNLSAAIGILICLVIPNEVIESLERSAERIVWLVVFEKEV